jgi:hypothetical protein
MRFKERMQKERLKRARRITIIISIFAFAAFLLAVYSFQLSNIATKQTVLARREGEKAKMQKKLAEDQKYIAQKSQAKAEESEKQALLQKSIAIAEQENAKKSEKNALLQKLIAEQQKAYAVRQKVISDQNAEIARQQQGIAETQTQRAVSNEKIAKEQTLISARLKDIAQARNLAYEAMMLLNDNKQEQSRTSIINAYKLNAENAGPNQNSDIYNALHFNWLGAVQNKNQFSAHKFAVRGISLGSSNNQLISVDESGMLYLLKADRGIIEPVSSYDLKAEARSVATSPDGNKALVVTSTGMGLLLDISSSVNSIKEISRIKFEGIGKLTLFKNNNEFAILTNRGLGIYSIGASINQIKFTN